MSVAAFVVGAVRNESGERRPREEEVGVATSTVLVAGVFAGASLLALLTAGDGVASYVALEAAAAAPPPRPPCLVERRLDDGVAAGRLANGSAKTMLELFENDAA
uniref:Uncharacterized protein n=1 Tax=Leersia perrieri TaxID=77586 RepID=A0A0D9XY48_9ORYZ